MSSQVKIEVSTRADNAKVTFYFHRMTNLDRRKTVRALYPQAERLTGVESVKASEHSFSVTLTDPSRADAITEQIVQLFCSRFRISNPERARLEPAASLT